MMRPFTCRLPIGTGLTLSLAFFLTLALGGTLQAQNYPTDNPYRTRYQPSGRHWTDSLHWQRIVDITGVTGPDWLERFNLAQDSVQRLGGGVVYFPAGTYTFTDGLRIRTGVIIRGQTPSPLLEATSPDFAPPTRFVFPEYVPQLSGSGTPNSTAFKTIATVANTSNAGIVFVDVNRGAIQLSSLTFATVTTPRGNTTHNQERNKNLIAFGCRSNNVASPYSTVPGGQQNAWQRFSSPFATNIRGFVWANLVIAQCRINDLGNNNIHPITSDDYEQPGYIAENTSTRLWVTIDSGHHAAFRYTDHTGISANRKTTLLNATPDEEPDAFRPGIEILHNWVYKTMRVGIMLSGLGVRCIGNVTRDEINKRVWLHPHGVRVQTNNAATYENRGIDAGGWELYIDSNDIEVVRHRFRSGYSSVDGEGILMQECCGGTSVRGVYLRGNTMQNRPNGKPFIGLWKMRDIYNVDLSGNNLNGAEIFMTANRGGGGGNFTFHYLYDVHIENNNNVGSMSIDGNLGGRGNRVFYNQGTGVIRMPCFVDTLANVGFRQVIFQEITYGTGGRLTAGEQCRDSVARFLAAEWQSPMADTLLPGCQGPIRTRLTINRDGADSVRYWLDARPVATVLVTPGQRVIDYTMALPAYEGTARRFLEISAEVRGIGQRYFLPVRRVELGCNTITAGRPGLPGRLPLSVYPQPARQGGQVTLRGLAEGHAALRLLDVGGRVIATPTVSPAGTLTLPSLTPGVYLLTVRQAAGMAALRLLVE